MLGAVADMSTLTHTFDDGAGVHEMGTLARVGASTQMEVTAESFADLLSHGIIHGTKSQKTLHDIIGWRIGRFFGRVHGG